MPELQHPDIVGNFLSSYGTAQAQQQAQKDRAFQQQRVMRQDERAEKQFDMEMDVGQLRLAAGRAEALDNILKKVRPGDENSLNQAKTEFVSTFGGDPQAVAGVTMDRVMELRAESDLKLKELRARIAATNRSNRPQPGGGGGGGFSSPVGEGDGLNPYEGITDPKQRDIMYRQLMTDFNSRQKDYQQTRVEAQNIIASTDEFLALNKKVGSGGVTGSGGLSSVPIVNSARNMVDSDWARMNAITDKLTPLMRQGLPGAASDRDMQTFRGATVGTGKLGEANVGIARGLQVAAKNAIDKGLFDEAYFRRNRHLQGSDNAWSRYLEENPIFDPRSDPTNPELNRSRKSWREYVSPSAQAAPSPTQQTGGIVPGTVEDGYVFRGGDPSNPANWSEAQ